MHTGSFNNMFGDMDLELMDLILKGHFEGRKRILDAGCGEGRNLFYFIQHDFDAYAMDIEKSAIDLTTYIFRQVGFPDLAGKLSVADIMDSGFESNFFDAVVCSRVLHFSESSDVFFKKWNELKRILRSGGLLYCSMDSAIGFERNIKQLDTWKWQFRDGTVRFTLTEDLLDELEVERDFEKIEQVKTIQYGHDHAQSIFALIKR